MRKQTFIPVARPALIGREKEYVLDSIESNWISSTGKYVELFEQRFADYLEVKNAITCSSGTAALHLALLALGVGSADEIIVPSLTYVATANAVKYTGAVPVFADSQPDTWNLDPADVERTVTNRTSTIVPAPLYGHPCDMDNLLDIAHRYGLRVVEDASEALGSRHKGRLSGTMSDLSTFSFYGNKIITAGEGGMVATNSDELAEKVRLLRGQGMDPHKRYWFPIIGYNYRMTNLQAAVGLAQLENIDRFIKKRRQIASWYRERLNGIESITLPVEREGDFHCYWMFSVLIEDECEKKRDEVMRYLSDRGVETRPFFYPIHTLPPYVDSGSENCEIAESLASRGINLPTFFDLSEDDVDYITSLLGKACK